LLLAKLLLIHIYYIYNIIFMFFNEKLIILFSLFLFKKLIFFIYIYLLII